MSADYNLSRAQRVLAGWFAEQHDRVSPGSGACRPTAFHGEGSYPGGRYFCFVDARAEPALTWTDARADVGAVADIYGQKGASGAASLLRQWRCCFR